jgi:hypothetical protein
MDLRIMMFSSGLVDFVIRKCSRALERVGSRHNVSPALNGCSALPLAKALGISRRLLTFSQNEE